MNSCKYYPGSWFYDKPLEILPQQLETIEDWKLKCNIWDWKSFISHHYSSPPSQTKVNTHQLIEISQLAFEIFLKWLFWLKSSDLDRCLKGRSKTRKRIKLGIVIGKYYIISVALALKIIVFCQSSLQTLGRHDGNYFM